MRDFKGMKRQRGRNRKPGGGGNANAANPNRSWDSQGPENIKVRGNAQTVYERYQQLARDAASSGDRVLAENYLQHAEHYFRVLRALQPQRPVSEIAARELAGQGFDIDFEDESGAQAAAFLAAQQAAERQQQQQQQQQAQPQGDNDGGQRDRDDRQAQDGEGGEGGSRRESRRERWERRREERNRRFEREGQEGAAAEAAPVDVEAPEVAEPAAEPRAEREPRRTRTPRRPAAAQAGESAGEEPMGLPGFLTRPTAVSEPAPSVAESAAGGDEPAPKRRAPRRRTAETPADSEG